MIEFNDTQTAAINGATEGYLAGKFTRIFQNLIRYDEQQIKEKMDVRFAYSHSGLEIIKQFFDKSSAELGSVTADIFQFEEIPDDLRGFIQTQFLDPLLNLHRIFSDKSALQADELFTKTFADISRMQTTAPVDEDKEMFAITLHGKLRDYKFETLNNVKSFFVEREAKFLSSILRREREASATEIEALRKEIETLHHHHELGGGVEIEMPHEAVASAAAAPLAIQAKQQRRKSI